MHRFWVWSGSVVAAVALAGGAVSGCSVSVKTGTGPPVVAKADLEKDITDRLAGAGQTPQSVACAEDLVGEVGKTTRCEVVFSQSNAIEPIVTATRVDGTTVNYEITPALSQGQLQQQVAMLLEQNSMPVETVSCNGRLEGVVGNEIRCSAVGGGETSDIVAKVTGVDGLLMNFRISPA